MQATTVLTDQYKTLSIIEPIQRETRQNESVGETAKESKKNPWQDVNPLHVYHSPATERASKTDLLL